MRGNATLAIVLSMACIVAASVTVMVVRMRWEDFALVAVRAVDAAVDVGLVATVPVAAADVSSGGLPSALEALAFISPQQARHWHAVPHVRRTGDAHAVCPHSPW